MRSKLFVPGSRPELFAKGMNSAADAISFDLEDAVASGSKETARTALASFLRQIPAECGKALVVRVNPVGSSLFAADMAAVVGPWLDHVNLPMTEDPAQVIEAAEALDRREKRTGAKKIGILVNIETPKALRRAAELAAAHPRVAGLQIGYSDLFEPNGIARADQAALSYVRIAVRMAAAEAGIDAFDGAFPGVKDPIAFRHECEAARSHGFAGKSCIHPTQIAIANAAFAPGEAEIAKARRILAAEAEAIADGVGAYMVDGQMVDEALVKGARLIVALAERQEAAAPKP